MGKDTPDWGGESFADSRYPINDMAELAVRLGSFIAFDRSGAVMWTDNFEDGFDKWTRSTTGTQSAVNLVSSPVETGGFAVELKAGGSVNSNANLYRTIEYFPTEKMGLTVSVKIPAALENYQQTLYHHDGANLWWYRLRLDFLNKRIQTYTTGMVYTTVISGIPDLSTAGHFVHFKHVADLTARRYGRVVFSNQVVADVALAPNSGASVSAPYFAIEISNNSPSGGISSLYVDNVYLTRLEV